MYKLCYFLEPQFPFRTIGKQTIGIEPAETVTVKSDKRKAWRVLIKVCFEKEMFRGYISIKFSFIKTFWVVLTHRLSFLL